MGCWRREEGSEVSSVIFTRLYVILSFLIFRDLERTSRNEGGEFERNLTTRLLCFPHSSPGFSSPFERLLETWLTSRTIGFLASLIWSVMQNVLSVGFVSPPSLDASQRNFESLSPRFAADLGSVPLRVVAEGGTTFVLDEGDEREEDVEEGQVSAVSKIQPRLRFFSLSTSQRPSLPTHHPLPLNKNNYLTSSHVFLFPFPPAVLLLSPPLPPPLPPLPPPALPTPLDPSSHPPNPLSSSSDDLSFQLQLPLRPLDQQQNDRLFCLSRR